MKHVIIASLIISTNLIGMLTTDVSTKKTHDDLFAIMATAEENTLQHKNNLTYLINLLHFNKLLELQLDKTNNKCFLFYKQYLSFYKECITDLLPREVCQQIDNTYSLLNNKIIKDMCTKKIILSKIPHNRDAPQLSICNNGHLFTHNIKEDAYNSTYITCINTKNYEKSYAFSPRSNNSIYFSPNNHYYITKELNGIYLYYKSPFKKHFLLDKCLGVTISNDSQYILTEERDEIMQSCPTYRLWYLDKQGKPQILCLDKKLYHSMAIAFHPDNNHIIHSTWNDTLHLYNIGTQKNKKITSDCNKDVTYINDLIFNHDNTRIIAETTLDDDDDLFEFGHVLFNIENIDNVTSITLPAQSCHTTSKLPVLCIPYQKMVTHVTDKGSTLQLLDETMQIIASHTAPKNSYISALAVDNTGNCLAIGHSDGTITLWDLCSHNKTIIISKGVVKSLTFGNNQLLLTQTNSGQVWGTLQPTPTPGSALLLDMYGNEIFSFGDNVIDSVISKNGKNIIIISLELEWNDKAWFPDWNRYVTLTSYDLHNKEIQQIFKTQKHSLTLTQMIANKNRKNLTIST